MMRIIALVLFLALVLSLAACGDEKAPKKVKKITPKAVSKKIKAKEVEAPQGKKVEIEYKYIAEGRRDPFASLLKIREPLNDETEPETPLQRFGLKELQLIAVVLGQNEPRAMVVAPDKKAYTLVAGVKVGRNRGHVVEITENKVVVEERYRDFSGALRTELKEIALPQREGE